MHQEESQGDLAQEGLTQEAAAPGGKSPPPPEMSPTLPLNQKICYALGGAPYQLTGNALGFFLQIFLLDVSQLEPFYASLILFLGRAWDSVADPTIGFLVSRSPQRRCGRLIPWIISSTPFGVFFYTMLWFLPSASFSTSLKFFWHLIMYCLFQTCMSCYLVPYSSLTMFLGGSQRDRDSATAYRMGVELLSTLVGTGIQGLIVGSHHARMTESCDAANGTRRNSTSLLPETLENARSAYVVASLVLGSLYCFACLVVFFGVKERPGPSSPLGKTKLAFCGSMRTILGHAPYTRLLGGFLFASLAFQLAQGIFAFFCTHVAGLAGSFQYLVLIMLTVACLTIPAWQWFLVRFGKKTAIFVGLLLVIPALIVITVVEHNFLLSVFMVIMAGSSLAVLYLLPWSMLPDAVDHFKLERPDCPSLEPFFYSLYVFFNKLAGGLSLGISTMSLHFAGYRATDCVHNPRVILTLRILMGPVPVTLLLCAMAVFSSYPINEEQRKRIRVEMEAAGQQGETECLEGEVHQALERTRNSFTPGLRTRNHDDCRDVTDSSCL